MSADDQREVRPAAGELERSEADGAKAPTWQELRDLADHNFRLYADAIAERDQLRATGAVADAVARATPCTCSAQRIRAERAEAERTELLLSRAGLADEVQRLRERVERHESGEVTAELRATVDRVRALFAGGPDTPCRTTWPDGVECVEVPMSDLRAAMDGTP